MLLAICIIVLVGIALIGFGIFFGGWFSNKSQVMGNPFNQESYGIASFNKFKELFDTTTWKHEKQWKWSLFYDKHDGCGNISEIHADIFMFNHIGMIMKTPIDYWKAIRYTHKYIKEHFANDLNKKNTKMYKWE